GDAGEGSGVFARWAELLEHRELLAAQREGLDELAVLLEDFRDAGLGLGDRAGAIVAGVERVEQGELVLAADQQGGVEIAAEAVELGEFAQGFGLAPR